MGIQMGELLQASVLYNAQHHVKFISSIDFI